MQEQGMKFARDPFFLFSTGILHPAWYSPGNPMKAWSSLFLLLLTSALGAQGQQEAGNSDPNIRPAGEVVLKFERKIEIPEIKRFREDGVLELFPGDTVHLEFEGEKGNLVRPKVVAKVTDPTRTITFKMTQDESITMLYRETGIQKTVALDCAHRGLRSETFSPTNLHPTEKGLKAFDSWPNSVWILRLSNIEVTSKSPSEVYKEKVSKSQEQEHTADSK
jgi:hypothetical protein